MARIRSVKPDVFKHEALFDAEREEGLPLRVAFIGLWTQCDREGRFPWRPRALKTDVLPYDDVDFSRVLHALATRGFIVKYASGGEEFGFIPSWHRHQVINNREAASTIPEPPENIEQSDACPTRAPRVTETHVHAQGERKGREGKGKEEEGGAVAPPYAFVGKVIRLKADDAERWRKAYHAIPDMTAELTKADDYYAENPPKDGKWFFPVSAWMERAHEAALGKRSDGKVMTKFGPMPAEYAKMYQGAL